MSPGASSSAMSTRPNDLLIRASEDWIERTFLRRSWRRAFGKWTPGGISAAEWYYASHCAARTARPTSPEATVDREDWRPGLREPAQSSPDDFAGQVLTQHDSHHCPEPDDGRVPVATGLNGQPLGSAVR